jgi:hypothetical protein
MEKLKNQKGLVRWLQAKAPHALDWLGIEMGKRVRMDARARSLYGALLKWQQE